MIVFIKNIFINQMSKLFTGNKLMIVSGGNERYQAEQKVSLLSLYLSIIKK